MQIARAWRPACSASACSRPCRSATIVDRADPGDEDGDGISGRANRVGDARTRTTGALGRFGWKANEPTVEQQNAGAFNGDIGITSPIFPDENCPPGQRACAAREDRRAPGDRRAASSRA